MTQLARRARSATRSVEIRVTTTGVAGSATGNTTSKQIVGQIVGVEVNWHASAPAGTSDITIEGATTGIDLYAKANAVTDVYKVPGVFGVDNAATALTGDVVPQKYCVAEPIKVTVAQSDALTDCVIVRIHYIPVLAEVIKVTTVGGDGVATGNTTSRAITGEVLGLAINYHASSPGATTDITIEGATTGLDLYAKADSATDVFAVPVLYSVDAAAAALTNDVTPRHYCIGEGVKVTLAQSNALTDAVIVTVFYIPVRAETIAVTTTGAAGSATGTTVGKLTHGEIIGLAINYHASAPGATTDIVVESVMSGLNIYAKSDSVTDVFVAPGIFPVTNADGSLASAVTPDRYFVGGPIQVTVAQSDALTNAAQVTVFSRP